LLKVELSCPSGCPEGRCSTTVSIHLDSDTPLCSNCLNLVPTEQQHGLAGQCKKRNTSFFYQDSTKITIQPTP
jgi:hypothetical protein